MQQPNLFDLVVSKSKTPSSALLQREQELWESGFHHIAGVDEVGRGPLAGPVVACACILPKGAIFDGVTDSKLLDVKERKRLSNLLKSHPDVHYALGIVSHEQIDQINILRATLLAMQLAVSALLIRPDFILVDGRDCPSVDLPKQAIIKGDSISQSIGAASIIAKVHRDELMQGYHELYPQYGFHKHKGYGTKMHLAAIYEHGICPIHRKSFAPCKASLGP